MQPELEDMNDPDEAHPRSSERLNFFLSATVSIEPHGKLTARVRNLSAGGMMVEFEAEPDPDLERGHRVVAELRSIGRIKGEIAWTGGRRFGIKFDRDIDPELARKPVTAGLSTPAYVKPVLVTDRSLKNARSLKGW